MINFAVIGTSNITFEFVTAAVKSGRYNLSAVYSRCEQKGKEFADKFGCKTVSKNVRSYLFRQFNFFNYIIDNISDCFCLKSITSIINKDR